MIHHDEMTPTNINAPSPPAETTADPIVVSKPQQSISAVSVVQPDPTPALATAPPVQEAAPPKTAGGNLVLQGTTAPPVPAVPMQQSQAAPQVLTPISTLKTS